VELNYADGNSVLAPFIFKAITTHQMAKNLAVHHRSLSVLLAAGANANAVTVTTDGSECTALMTACVAPCCTAPVRILLAHGANPCQQTAEGKTALHSAARAGRIDLCMMLLEASSGRRLDVRDSLGCTPLADAVNGGHVQVVEVLHKRCGANLDIRSPDGVTLLHLAAQSGQRPVLEYLLQNGADVHAAMKGSMVTPVSIAAANGNAAAVQILLDHGASTTKVNSGGDNLLCVAAKTGQANAIELLLSSRNTSQPAVDLNTPASNGATPLLVAAARSSIELVQQLLDAGADVAAHAPVLHVAAGNSAHPEVLQLLLEQSSAAAVIDTVTVQCGCCGTKTALMSYGQPAHLKLLLAAGVDVHKTTDRGNTALHVAAVHKFAAPVICLLIKAGVDLQAENSDGKTAAQVAADSGNALAAALLTRAARDS
jgi:ankyrin repeat protein